jgi:hypothetical protein
MMRALILGHRYIGIATCLLFAMWFGSGVVMMCVGFPRLTAVGRFKGLAPLDLRTAHVLPPQALAVAVVDGRPRELRLEMVLGSALSITAVVVAWSWLRRIGGIGAWAYRDSNAYEYLVAPLSGPVDLPVLNGSEPQICIARPD